MGRIDPIQQFTVWYQQAKKLAIDKPHAMVLSTVGVDGRPSSRMVLLSSYDENGFVFHTNYNSRKGCDIAHKPWASMLFWWDPLGYQVRLEGTMKKTTQEESDLYFAKRPRGSQLSALASDQSQTLAEGYDLMRRVQELDLKYQGKPIPRPLHWGGYRLIPNKIEFWENRENRLHDRVLYLKKTDGLWEKIRLAP
jgi:pyridoxamine 5'-phosphate oxidase